MLNKLKLIISAVTVVSVSLPTAFAGDVVGMPASFSGAGILGFAAIGVIGGVWLARRKRESNRPD